MGVGRVGAEREEPVRRSVVPPAAGRSLWLAALWTGAGAAFVAAVVAIVGVAVCWLPASGGSGHTESAIRAGLLTFLAGLHGGITVDGVHAGFVPLGLTVAVALIAWRAGSGLADVADDLDEEQPGRLVQAAGLQAFTFAIACGIVAAMSSLGSSHVSAGTAVMAGLLLWVVTGTVAFVRSSALTDGLTERAPGWLVPAIKIGAAGAAVYLIGGAMLVAGSLIVHHGAVSTLSGQIGGGWAGLPVLLLGLLAAPNAAVAGAGYLAGPGFAVGSGTSVALGTTTHGLVPAFPLLGALPSSGHTATATWLLVAITPFCAAWCVAALAHRAPTHAARWRDLAAGAAVAAVIGAVAAWLAGGGIGSGRLATVGVSPLLFGGALAGAVLGGGAVLLGLATAVAAVRGTRDDGLPGERRLRDLYETLTDEPQESHGPRQSDRKAPVLDEPAELSASERAIADAWDDDALWDDADEWEDDPDADAPYLHGLDRPGAGVEQPADEAVENAPDVLPELDDPAPAARPDATDPTTPPEERGKLAG